MITHKMQTSTAVLSNVGAVNSFSIKATSHSFQILSASLYANKIKAIIRELSTNAYDSHKAAGKPEIPFTVHLPNSLEPYFSVQDYGIGLTEEEVTNIFTTFFESTKTDSNDYVGALGLGSKSPFSYTNNFTITSVKNGTKNIFTAFINDAGVPSIAKMYSEASDEPSGVEIKFAVDNRHDFYRFSDEACSVYKHFTIKPNIIGADVAFKIPEIQYAIKDLANGVHLINIAKHAYGSPYAVMGNIAYPIDIPHNLISEISKEDQEAIHEIRNVPLEIHFAIGEIEFQPSREGLSYTKATINALVNRMKDIKSAIYERVKSEVDAIDGQWEKARKISKFKDGNVSIMTNAANQYPMNEQVISDYYDIHVRVLESALKDLNIQISVFTKSQYTNTLTSSRDVIFRQYNEPEKNHYRVSMTSDKIKIIVNDTKTGLGARVNYSSHSTLKGMTAVYVLSKVDKAKDMDIDGFKTLLLNPPVDIFLKGSDLNIKPVEKRERVDFTDHVLRLERRGGGKGNSADMVWRDLDKKDIEHFADDTKTFYYVELSGTSFKSKFGHDGSMNELHTYAVAAGILMSSVTVYGVRKAAMVEAQSKKNWINLEDYIVKKLKSYTEQDLLGLVKSELDRMEWVKYNAELMAKINDNDGHYFKTISELKDTPPCHGGSSYVVLLADEYLSSSKKDKAKLDLITDRLKNPRKIGNELYKKYPLLKSLSVYSVNISDVAQYINMIDKFIKETEK